MTGNSTFLMGVEDGDIDRAVQVIKNDSKSGCRISRPTCPAATREAAQPAITVTVGGATVFVLNIEE